MCGSKKEAELVWEMKTEHHGLEDLRARLRCAKALLQRRSPAARRLSGLHFALL